MASYPLPPSTEPGTYLPYSYGSGPGICMKILFLVSIPTGTWSSLTTSVASLTYISISTGQPCSVMMHSSIINVQFRASHSVPLISSSMSQPSMLQQLRSQHADASSASTSIMRSSTVPFPWGPCWGRIQLQRRLLKASRAGEHTDNNSSIPAPGAPAPNCLPSTTRTGRSALNSNQVPAASPTAEGSMCAGTVSKTTQLQNVILQVQ